MHFTTTTIILTTALALSASALPRTTELPRTTALPSTTPLPSITKRYVPGQCGAHIQQYQKNEGPGDKSKYRFTIEIKDANGAPLGGVNTAAVADGGSVDVTTSLPDVFIATAGFVDADPVTFAYNGQHWDSGSSQCKFGGYDSGSRQGDCGFTC